MDTTTTASGYPARWRDSGRRAREVMPAAMRAEVRMSASAWRSCHRARIVACAAPAAQALQRRQATVLAGMYRRHRDADAQAVARVVGQARAVLGALVDVVDVVGDGAAELALDRHQCGSRPASLGRRRRLRADAPFTAPTILRQRPSSSRRLGAVVAPQLHARGAQDLVDRLHPQHLRIVRRTFSVWTTVVRRRPAHARAARRARTAGARASGASAWGTRMAHAFSVEAATRARALNRALSATAARMAAFPPCSDP